MESILSKDRIRKSTVSPELLKQLEEQEKRVRIWIDQHANLDILYLNELEDLNTEVFNKFILNEIVENK
jgi:hypothetical protein